MNIKSFVYIGTGNFSSVFHVRFERKVNKFKPVILVNHTLQGKKEVIIASEKYSALQLHLT